MFNAAIIDLETGVQTVGRSVNYERLDDGIEVMARLSGDLTDVKTSGALEISSPTGDDAGEQAPVEESWDEVIRARAEASRRQDDAKKKPGGGAAFGYGLLNLALGLGSFVQKDVGGGVATLLLYGAAGGLIGWELTLSYHDDLAGIPGTVGLGVAGVAALIGFIRPFVYQKNHTLAGVLDGIRMGAAPAEGGGAAVRLSYTMRF
jgi:hypothetical protein